MRGDRIPFSHLLPLIDLALLALLVFVPITLTALHLYASSKGAAQLNMHSGRFDITLPRSQIVPWAIRMETVPKAPLVKAINLPGIIFDILVSLPTSWPATWHPQALPSDTWDALVYPFYCLPFWWLVGCGMDGLLKRERLHWSLLLIGTLLCSVCLISTFGFRFGLSTSERQDTGWLVAACIGWTIAFGLLPTAWIAQRIRQRREPQSQAASL